MSLVSISKGISQATINLEQAIKIAKSNHLNIKSGNLRIQQALMLKDAAFEMPKTSFAFQLGQYSTINIDHQFTIEQPLPNRKVFRAQKALAEAQVNDAETQLRVSEQELVYQIKLQFENLAYLRTRLKLLEEEDTIYKTIFEQATIRYAKKEAKELDPYLAKQEWVSNQELKVETQADIRVVMANLQMLLNLPSLPFIETLTLSQRTLPVEQKLHKNPILIELSNQATIAACNIDVEKAQLAPEFKLGYSNLSIIGVQTVGSIDKEFTGSYRFHVLMGGVTFPLFKKASKARIAAASLEQQIVSYEGLKKKQELQVQLTEVIQDYIKNKEHVSFFEKTALPLAELTVKKAEVAVKNREMNYHEYLQTVLQLKQTRLLYWEAIYDMNKSVLIAHYLVGQ
jgi:cobalt-zinc-cadmium resistance protein CzcA